MVLTSRHQGERFRQATLQGNNSRLMITQGHDGFIKSQIHLFHVILGSTLTQHIDNGMKRG